MIVVRARLLAREDARVPLRPVDLRIRLHPLLVGMPPARFDDAVRPVGPPDQHDRVVVDGVRAVPRADGRADALGRGIAEDEPSRVDRVHAHVHEAASASERGVDEPPRGTPAGVDPVSPGLDDLAELARDDPVSHRDHVVVEPPAVGDHQGGAASMGRVDHRVALRDGDRHRLLDEHVLARFQEGDGLLGVERVRRGDDRRLDGLVGRERSPVGDRAGIA